METYGKNPWKNMDHPVNSDMEKSMVSRRNETNTDLWWILHPAFERAQQPMHTATARWPLLSVVPTVIS